MKILLDDKSTEEARRAAREQVLRQMRLQRDRLLKNPWLRKIGENPIDAISVMTALSYLRTTLKRIEIETLVGV